MVARVNAGDVEGSPVYFADDAVAYIVGLPPTGMEVYAGKEQIRALWQDSVANHFQWEVNIMSANGNIVNVKAKTWHDFTRQLGVAPLEYNDVYEVRDGKITVNLNITDQSNDLYALTMFNLDQDKDFVDLMMSTSGMPSSWADILLMEELEPGLSNTYTFTVENGPIYMICWSKPPDLPFGNAGPFVVIESS